MSGTWGQPFGSVGDGNACTDDDNEPNDDDATATPVDVDDLLRNQGITSSSDDWYLVEIPAGDSIRVTLTFAHAAGDLRFRVYNQFLDLFGTVDSSNDGETSLITNDDPTPLEVYIQVEQMSGACNLYDISFQPN